MRRVRRCGRAVRRGQPAREGAGGEVVRLEQVDAAERAQPPGADELLAARLDARHDERAAARGEDLAARVVAAHRDDVVGERDEGVGVGQEVEQAHVVAGADERLEALALLGGHERPGDDDAGRALGQPAAGERVGEAMAVLAAAHEAHRKAAAGQLEALATARVGALGEAVDVAAVAHHARDVGRDLVLDDRVVDARVAVDPDGVVVAAQDVEGAVGVPLGVDAVGLVEHLAHAQDELRAHARQQAEARRPARRGRRWAACRRSSRRARRRPARRAASPPAGRPSRRRRARASATRSGRSRPCAAPAAPACRCRAAAGSGRPRGRRRSAGSSSGGRRPARMRSPGCDACARALGRRGSRERSGASALTLGPHL